MGIATINQWLANHVRQVEAYEPRGAVKPYYHRTSAGLTPSGFTVTHYETALTRLADHILWTVGAKVDPVELYEVMRAAGYQFIHDDWRLDQAVCVNVAGANGAGLFLPFERAPWDV